jgi:hypothetical protein
VNTQDVSLRAWTFSVFFSCIYVMLMFVLSHFENDVTGLYYDLHIIEFGIVSTSRFITSYLALYFFLLACGAAATLSGRPLASPSPGLAGTTTVAFVCTILWFCLFHAWFLHALGAVLAVAWLAVLRNRLRPGRLARGMIKAVFVAAICLFFYCFYLLPLFFPLFIDSYSLLSNIELHYAMTVLPGFVFGVDGYVGFLGKQNYGFSMPLLVMLGNMLAGFITSDGARLVFTVKVFQLAAMGIFLYNLFLLNRRYFLPLCLGSLFLLYSLNTVGLAVYFPNQSGIRYVPLLLGLLFLTSKRRRVAPRPLLFSLAAGLLIAASPETGLAFLSGAIMFIAIKEMNAGKSLVGIAATVAKTLVFSLAFFGLAYFALNAIFLRGPSQDLFSNLQTFAQGFGGTVSKPHLVAVLAFATGVYLVFRGAFRAAKRMASTTDAYQAAVGTIMLTWLLYYVARQDEWNLWFQTALMILCIAPRFSVPSFRLFTKSSPAYYMSCAMILAALSAMGAASATQVLNYKEHVKFFNTFPISHYTSRLFPSPYFFHSPEEKIAYQTKMDYLRGVRDVDDTLVFSNLPVSVRLCGFNKNVVWYDVFGEVNSLEKIRIAAQWIQQNPPGCILVDDPDSGLSARTPNHFQHYRRIMDLLDEYVVQKKESGWIVYERRGR